MGRLTTHLAAAVANADNLPPANKLEQISLWDALLPKSCSQPKKKITVKYEVGRVVPSLDCGERDL